MSDAISDLPRPSVAASRGSLFLAGEETAGTRPADGAEAQEVAVHAGGTSPKRRSNIEKSAEELLRISKEAQFRKALSTARYEYHANSFQRAAEIAIEMAKAKNIDG
jgi:hypothetical protein